MHARRSIVLAGSQWCNRLPLSPKIGRKELGVVGISFAPPT
jgi:hypothetical protein